MVTKETKLFVRLLQRNDAHCLRETMPSNRYFDILKLKKYSGFHISLGYRTDFKPCLITTCEIGKKQIGLCK